MQVLHAINGMLHTPIVPGEKTFKKGQSLHYINGYATERPLKLVGDIWGAEPVTKRQQEAALSSPKWDPSSTLPKWVENDRKVLRFYGYLKESVAECRLENHRIRKVVIYYYLSDDTMHVAEPKKDNSGLPQGVFVKRHKMTKEDGSPFTPKDFALGQTVDVYGRKVFLIDCDDFTREYMTSKMGVQVGESLQCTTDPIEVYQAAYKRKETGIPPNPRTDDLTRFLEAKLGKPPNVLEEDRLQQFLENNRRVLRFWCLWDDRTSLYGDRRPYVLHYFLEDDTGEILEVNENNSGRDPFPIFLKRGPLKKEQAAFMSVTNRTYKDQCYCPEDFRLGSSVHIQNRSFLIHDCDDFTRRWYMENLGLPEEALRSLDTTEPIPPCAKSALPPHNDYGTLEDTQQNCLSLLPKPPKKNFHKLMNKDSIVLRFRARMLETDRFKLSVADRDRKFIISYFMADDTISVYEPPLRNSGIIGGKFLERSRIFKPSSEEAYSCCDLYYGATIVIHRRSFELLEADEFTYTYMENNRHVFVMADTDALMRSLQKQVSGREDEVRTCFINVDTDGTGCLSMSELEAALEKANFKFTKHQAVALGRRMDKDKSGQIDVEEFLTAIGVTAADAPEKSDANEVSNTEVDK
ncbi:unnamed protein product [Ostreobium quekettii]|uniref:Uncharacterized protein n=1 Tax=Ostreobium quekettii TaxID=121088 RepID=A0A8S1J5F7_9CHLO|nr:unnamed protein product [Ostreobium quekettii]